MKPRKPKQKIELELDPDAWPRFEQFVKDMAKAGPKHREPAKPKGKRRTEKRG